MSHRWSRLGRLFLSLVATVLAALFLPSCGGKPDPALIVRPGSTPAPVEHTHSDPVERPSYHWFGKVPFGDVARHTFVLENRSSRTVSVVRALPSCSCLGLEVRSKDASGSVLMQLHEAGTRAAEVPAGGTLEVEFVIDTRHERLPNWPRLVQASIYTTDPTVPVLQLEGTVIAVTPFQMLKDHLSFGTVAADAIATQRETITQAGARDVVLTTRVLESPPDWTVRVFENEQSEGLARSWTVQVTLPPGAFGPIVGSLKLEAAGVDGASAAPYVVPVRGERGSTVFASSERIFFRADSKATTLRIASRLPVEGAEIASVEIDGPLAPALRHEVARGSSVRGTGPSWTLLLEIVGDAPAECSGRVRVNFVDDLWPPLEIPYARFK